MFFSEKSITNAYIIFYFYEINTLGFLQLIKFIWIFIVITNFTAELNHGSLGNYRTQKSFQDNFCSVIESWCDVTKVCLSRDSFLYETNYFSTIWCFFLCYTIQLQDVLLNKIDFWSFVYKINCNIFIKKYHNVYFSTYQ